MTNFSGLPSAKKLRQLKKSTPQYYKEIIEEYKESNPDYYEKIIKPLEYGLSSAGGKGRLALVIGVSILIAILGIVVMFLAVIEK